MIYVILVRTTRRSRRRWRWNRSDTTIYVDYVPTTYCVRAYAVHQFINGMASRFFEPDDEQKQSPDEFAEFLSKVPIGIVPGTRTVFITANSLSSIEFALSNTFSYSQDLFTVR